MYVHITLINIPLFSILYRVKLLLRGVDVLLVGRIYIVLLYLSCLK